MRVRLFLLMLPLLLCGCVTSTDPQFGPDSRVLPFLPGASFDIARRSATDPDWGPANERVTLVADQELVVRELDDDGKPREYPRHTFHPFAPGAYIVQSQMQRDKGYAYGALYVREGEARLFMLNCEFVDKARFREFRGTVEGDFCRTDTMSEPGRFLNELARRPVGAEARYIPVPK